MDDSFKIYVKQLRDGQVEKIEENFSTDFLDVHEKDLVFSDPVKVSGEAYLADNELVLHLDIQACGIIPCAICNEGVKVKIAVPDFYHAVPLNEVTTGIYNFSDILRETILLETPLFAECGGCCPRRKDVQKYMKKNSSEGSGNAHEEEGYHPFADLDLK